MNLKRKLYAALASVGLVLGGISLGAPAAQAAAPCVGVWNVGVGGFVVTATQGSWQSSTYIRANQHVGYHSTDPASGLRELDRLVFEHRSQCPGDHIKIVGHSMGAAIVHQWVAEHQWFPRANAVLLADPKRLADPWNGPSGLANNPLNFVVGYPLRGVDANFGAFPVESICRWQDVICRDTGNWWGYVTGVHNAYNYDAFFYGTNMRGTLMLP